MATTPNRPVKTVETASAMLAAIKAEGRLTLPELATELGLAKSTVHRHLETLENLNLVVRDGDAYRIGLRLLDLGLHARNERQLYHVAMPKVDELADKTGEKVWCITEEHGRSVHLYGASGEHSVQTHARKGQRGYLHQLAAGKAILSTLSRARVDEIVASHGLPKRTENTITDPDELFDNLERITERGYAFNREESVPRLNSVGVPITNPDGRAVGAISVSGPAHRVKDERFTDTLPDLLLGATNEIEINLSHA